ncbi:unnamed protein product [Ixodes pacificus]
MEDPQQEKANNSDSVSSPGRSSPASQQSDHGSQSRPPPEHRVEAPVAGTGTSRRRRAVDWEIMQGLRSGQRCEDKPRKFEGYLLKRRKWPLKGWHKRFFCLEKGILTYAKSSTDMAKGKNHGSVDLGLSVISTKGKGRRVDIDAEEFIYHLKVKNQAQFQQWVPQLRHHRLYRQHEIAFGSREAPKMTSPAVEDTSTVPTPGGNGYGSSSAACFDASLPKCSCFSKERPPCRQHHCYRELTPNALSCIAASWTGAFRRDLDASPVGVQKSNAWEFHLEELGLTDACHLTSVDLEHCSEVRRNGELVTDRLGNEPTDETSLEGYGSTLDTFSIKHPMDRTVKKLGSLSRIRREVVGECGEYFCSFGPGDRSVSFTPENKCMDGTNGSSNVESLFIEKAEEGALNLLKCYNGHACIDEGFKEEIHKKDSIDFVPNSSISSSKQQKPASDVTCKSKRGDVLPCSQVSAKIKVIGNSPSHCILKGQKQLSNLCWENIERNVEPSFYAEETETADDESQDNMLLKFKSLSTSFWAHQPPLGYSSFSSDEHASASSYAAPKILSTSPAKNDAVRTTTPKEGASGLVLLGSSSLNFRSTKSCDMEWFCFDNLDTDGRSSQCFLPVNTLPESYSEQIHGASLSDFEKLRCGFYKQPARSGFSRGGPSLNQLHEELCEKPANFSLGWLRSTIEPSTDLVNAVKSSSFAVESASGAVCLEVPSKSPNLFRRASVNQLSEDSLTVLSKEEALEPTESSPHTSLFSNSDGSFF